jgi:hypothetical protein
MIRNSKKSSSGVPPPYVRAGSKKGGRIAMPQTTFGPARTFHSSPSPRHHMLSSAVADTNLPLTSNTKLGLNTVSPGMKQRVPPGMIDNGGVFELPDDISDLDGMAKVVQPNTITSGISGCFDELFHSQPHSLLTEPSFFASQYPPSSHDWYGPASTRPYSSPPKHPRQGQPSATSTSKSNFRTTSNTRPPSSVSINSSTPTSTLKSSPSNFSPYPTGSSSEHNVPSSRRRRICRKTKKKPRCYSPPEILIEPSLVAADPLSQMSFSNSSSGVSTGMTVPAFTGPVTTPRFQSSVSNSSCLMHERRRDTALQLPVHQPSLPHIYPSSLYGASVDSAIDIMSSSEEDECDDMPELLEQCHNRYDSSSDEEWPESVRECSTSRKCPTASIDSFFENEVNGTVENVGDDGMEFCNTSPTFSTNRPQSHCKHKHRRRNKLRTVVSMDVSTPNVASVIGNKKKPRLLFNTNPSDPPEYHSAGSKIWSSSLCPKGLCLVIQTESEVHLVQDCLPGQVYVFRQLTSIVHQQQVQSQLASFLKEGFRHDFPVLLYRNHRDHISPFCVILNNTNSTSPILDLMEFKKMNRLLVEVDPNNGIGCLRQAERSSLSYGFASSRCMRRGVKGTAVPALLKDTSDPFIQKLFVTMSLIFGLEVLPFWAKYIPEVERLPFAKSIAKDNLLEGLTIHLTNHDNLLQPHKDLHNPPYSDKSKLSLVVGASQWVDGNRIGATGYFRKSVTECMVRYDTTAPLLEELTTVYSGLPPQRRHLSPEMFVVAHNDGCHIDKNHFTVPCNIDPMGECLFPIYLRLSSATEHFFLFLT